MHCLLSPLRAALTGDPQIGLGGQLHDAVSVSSNLFPDAGPWGKASPAHHAPTRGTAVVRLVKMDDDRGGVGAVWRWRGRGWEVFGLALGKRAVE